MGRSQPKRREQRDATLSRIWLLTGLLAGVLLGACTPTPTPEPEPTPRPPSVQFLQAPPTLCRDATQLRLDVQVAGPEISDANAAWSLHGEGGNEPLNRGSWSGESGELYVPFPDGAPLAPGDYEIRVVWQDRLLASQPFTIQDEAPAIEDLWIALTPGGEPQTRLVPEVRHFYVQLTYEDACPGTPYWLTITDDAGVACTRNGRLDAQAGTTSIPCYRNDGLAFAEGSYEATVTLMEETQESQAFDIASPIPTPTSTPRPTATPSPPKCGSLFTAAGLTPGGEPFLPLTRFDWYTQAIYVGAECDRLAPRTSWQSLWYRNGEQVRRQAGTWNGEPEGVIWDSLTGVPGSPFLIPGTYTITMQIAATDPLTTEIRVLPYPSEE